MPPDVTVVEQNTKQSFPKDSIFAMLPCNAPVIEQGENFIEVVAVNPIASMQANSNPALGEVAQQVTNLLQLVIKNL
jgi:uncharacterized protein (DUF302 family)